MLSLLRGLIPSWNSIHLGFFVPSAPHWLSTINALHQCLQLHGRAGTTFVSTFLRSRNPPQPCHLCPSPPCHGGCGPLRSQRVPCPRLWANEIGRQDEDLATTHHRSAVSDLWTVLPSEAQIGLHVCVTQRFPPLPFCTEGAWRAGPMSGSCVSLQGPAPGWPTMINRHRCNG